MVRETRSSASQRFFSSFPVPPNPPVILGESGRVLLDATDHLRVGATATLVCESSGGDPLPRLSWWRGSAVVDDVVEEVDAAERRVRNTLRLPALRRADHGAKLTCRAANTNLTAPASTSVNINMVCEYRHTGSRLTGSGWSECKDHGRLSR